MQVPRAIDEITGANTLFVVDNNVDDNMSLNVFV